MSFSNYIKHIWAPILLGIHIAGLFFAEYGEFYWDMKLQFTCIALTILVFYTTHHLAYLMTKSFIKDRPSYWKSSALAYIPLIISFWGLYTIDQNDLGEPFDLSPLVYPILGLFFSYIFYAGLLWKKLEYDLDNILAILFMSFVFLCLTSTFYGFIFNKLELLG